MISAWAAEQLVGTTLLTPMETNLPLASSNTPAAKGPPVLFLKFAPAKQRTVSILFSTLAIIGGNSSVLSMAHCGSCSVSWVTVVLACMVLNVVIWEGNDDAQGILSLFNWSRKVQVAQ
jgi:hypothetical protein